MSFLERQESARLRTRPYTLLEAMTATVRFDPLETPAEGELVRTIAASLRCPLPRAAWIRESLAPPLLIKSWT